MSNSDNIGMYLLHHNNHNLKHNPIQKTYNNEAVASVVLVVVGEHIQEDLQMLAILHVGLLIHPLQHLHQPQALHLHSDLLLGNQLQQDRSGNVLRLLCLQAVC